MSTFRVFFWFLIMFLVVCTMMGALIINYAPPPTTNTAAVQAISQLEINQSLLDRQKKLEDEVYKLQQLMLRYTGVPPEEYQAWRPEEQPVP